MTIPWFMWADDSQRFMIICPEHLVQKKHWKQKGGVKLCIPAAFTQSLLELKTGAGNGCSCFSWIHCEMLGVWWNVQCGFRGYCLSNFDCLLHVGQWALSAHNGKYQATEINQAWSELWFDCSEIMTATHYNNLLNKKTKKILPWGIVPLQSPVYLITEFNTSTIYSLEAH